MWKGWAALGVTTLVGLAMWSFVQSRAPDHPQTIARDDPSETSPSAEGVVASNEPDVDERAGIDTATPEEKYAETPGVIFIPVPGQMERAAFLSREKLLELLPKLRKGSWAIFVQAPVTVHSGSVENMWGRVTRLHGEAEATEFAVYFEPTDSGYQPPSPKQRYTLDELVDWYAIGDSNVVHGMYKGRFLMEQMLAGQGKLPEAYAILKSRFVDPWMPSDGRHPAERRN